jgi:hypothetical protein
LRVGVGANLRRSVVEIEIVITKDHTSHVEKESSGRVRMGKERESANLLVSHRLAHNAGLGLLDGLEHERFPVVVSVSADAEADLLGKVISIELLVQS